MRNEDLKHFKVFKFSSFHIIYSKIRAFVSPKFSGIQLDGRLGWNMGILLIILKDLCHIIVQSIQGCYRGQLGATDLCGWSCNCLTTVKAAVIESTCFVFRSSDPSPTDHHCAGAPAEVLNHQHSTAHCRHLFGNKRTTYGISTLIVHIQWFSRLIKH